MPHRLGQLTNLQTLSRFVLGDSTSFGSRDPKGMLNELENLNNLRGELEIVVEKDGSTESKVANLKRKQHLQSLILDIEGKIVDDDCEGLLSHLNIKELKLKGDCIHECVGLLNYLPSLTNLVRFSLRNQKRVPVTSILK